MATLADVDSPSADDAEFFARVRQFETDVRANVLLKDSQFIANLLHRHVEVLEYCIYASKAAAISRTSARICPARGANQVSNKDFYKTLPVKTWRYPGGSND